MSNTSKKAGLGFLLVVLTVCLAPLSLSEKYATTSSNEPSGTFVEQIVGSVQKTLTDSRFNVPHGFVVNIYASELAKPRMLHMTAFGDLLVSQPQAGSVIKLSSDGNRDGVPDGRSVLMSGLTRPHGLEIVDGWLYVAESNQVGRVKFDERSGNLLGEYQVLIKGLADHGGHWTKTIRAGEDGWMYLSSGSSCNVCEEKDSFRAAISRFKLNTPKPRLALFAKGLRNSVGMDWSPWDQTLYATDNGRDMLGDDYPPCELNKIVEGGFYGWPYINGFADLDPDYGRGRIKGEASLKLAISPVHGFRAHNAPLGMRFIRGDDFPSQYQKAALVALHGSWNRSSKDGYKVVSLHWLADGSVQERDFMTGFLRTDKPSQPVEKVIGRPVDIAEGIDGSVYVSDDYSGTVFKVTYVGGKQ